MKLGLIGYPIAHSRSPQLFAAAHPGGEHTYDLIEEPEFEKAYNTFLGGYDAVNVTMPFKELAYFRCTPGSEAVSQIKAVNILKKASGGRILGFNSDYLGVLKILREENPAGRPCLVVGSGGAAKAAAVAAAEAGFSVTMTNRSFEKCHAFVRHCSIPLKAAELDGLDTTPFSHIIYAVPVPVAQLSEWDFAGKTVMEANYANPCLEEKCRREGARYLSGLVWLQAQADTGFEIMLSTL